MTTLAQSKIPTRFWKTTLDEYEVDRGNVAKSVVSDYIERLPSHLETGKGLTLAGPPGGGKSMLASIIGTAALEAGYSVLYCPLAEYIRWGLNLISWGNREEFDEEWAATQRRLLRVRNKLQFLLLDDVGKEHITSSKFAEDEFDFLVRHRFDRALPTIITTNVEVEKWGMRYSDSMASFAREAFPEVEVLSNDRRGR